MASAEVQIAPPGTVETGPGQPRRQITRREDRVVGEHEEASLLLDQSLQEFRGSGQGVFLAHQDAVHIGEPALGGLTHAFSLSSQLVNHALFATPRN